MNAGALLPMLLAVALDLAFGDPPNRLHPVAWIGSALVAARRRLIRPGRVIPLLLGASLMVVGVAFALALGIAISLGLAKLPTPAGLIVEAIMLKSLFSIRGLARAARAVAEALDRCDLPEARRLASWHLVSRPTEGLDGPFVAAAAIESVAENASDSIVAPLLYYGVFGLPGALAYRFINTADSLFGYRDPEREWLGKVPARLDDLANLIPARLSALMMVLAAPVAGGSSVLAFRIWRRDASKTASPNAGRPMSAAAGALGVELEKVGAYHLGAGLRLPGPDDIGRSIRLLWATTGLALIPIAALKLLLATRHLYQH
ncbi:adenosylcobinamide-phosphate synthase CbiB [Singulisphaera sp. PoT]|uniref:adenosylcobinamide-phosphate synthase CbiB n=1 Tax=Singulisphaera sp. PoT TaxID=3411797 RepID=UPI003BF55B5D